MEEDKLAARIRPLEAFAAAKPQLYRFRVALLALLGYAYLLFVVVFLLAIVAVTLYFVRINAALLKILWIPVVLAGLVLRSLWITIPEPDGKELQRGDAPALFDLMDEVSKTLNGPKVDHVLVSDDFNASVVQIPQFGMFGWLRNYLVVGLPLMRALTAEEFRAVLAHEFGHLSGKHGGFSAWIYRVRISWLQILVKVHQERSYASFLFEPFLAWYGPYLNAYSFVLARAQEREADTYAVDLAGKDTTALALTRLETKQRGVMEDFWPKFFRGAKKQSLTPRDTFTQMLAGYEQPTGHTKAQRRLLEALREPTGYEDTHPALGDRLAAIGVEKDGAEVTRLIEAVVKADEARESAAARYLPTLPDDFEPSMNRLWRERVAHVWSERHEEIKKSGKRLAELEEHAKTRALTVDEQWERAVAVAENQDEKASIPFLRALLQETPDHGGANFALGSILLSQDNAEGIPYLEKTMNDAPDIAQRACELISGFYLEQGNNELGEEFRKRAEAHYQKAQRLQEQALKFTPKDNFAPHDLAEDRIKELKAQLAKVYGLAAAYLVRKIIDGSDQSIYVLAVVAGYTWKDGVSGKHVDALFDELSGKVELPSPIAILSLDGQHAYLLDRISRVAGAQLFATPDVGLA
jgi:Zn-dependent protease with chaperone function